MLDIKSKSKSLLLYLLLLIPAVTQAFAVYQFFFIVRIDVSLPILLWFLAFLFSSVLMTALLLWLGRESKTSLPSDLSLLTGAVILFCVLPPRGLSADIIESLYDIYAVRREPYVFALALSPFTYALLLALRNTAAQFYQHTWLGNSLLARFIRFLGKGKTLRRKLLIEILVCSAIVLAASVCLLLTIFQRTNGFPTLVYLRLCLLLPFLTEVILILCVLLGHKHSVGAEMERISTAIAESSQGHFPTENPVSPTSPLHETGEALMELGRQTEDGIRRGMAGERLKVELITNVSHDLRTPLTSIVGYGERLERADLPADAATTARALTAKAKYLSAMVNDLFDMAKTASGNITPIKSELDLTRLIEQTLAEMEDRVKASGFAIKTDFSASETSILADGMRLHRVVQNLIDNALKYSLRGTRIFLSTRNEGETVVASILNTAGYEMAFGDIDLTERFTRGDAARTGEGSGLGLAIAKTYTEAMGGRFDISVRGDSFEAILTFPVADQTEKLPT